MEILKELLKNEVLWSMVFSFVVAQTVKGLINHDFKKAFSYGGMPSGHAALVTGMAISIGFNKGFDSSVFALSIGFMFITLSDAVRVRPKIERGLGHTWGEVITGGLVGLGVAIFIHLVFRCF